MVSLGSLLVPIVVAAVLVFIASSIIHMFLRYHKADYKGLSNEDDVRAAIRKGNATPGLYVFPYCLDPKEAMGDTPVAKKYVEGPVGFLSLVPPGKPNMGPALIKWFVYCLVLSFFVAYLGSHVLAPGSSYLTVFRVVGTAGWLGYAGASAAGAIWMGKPWSNTVREIVDGLIYGMLTAGTFGWLWPK